MRAAVLTLTFLLAACAHDDASIRGEQRPHAVSPYTSVSDRLFCGLSMAGGGVVSDAEVERFLSEVVEPRFPDGFTVWRARGRWRGGSEETLVIEIVRPAALAGLVQEIADEYRVRFRQQAVLRVTTPAQMQLVE